MPQDNLDLLDRLCTTPGVSGREDRVRHLIEKEVEGLFDELRTDPMGSLIGVRKARGGKGKKNGKGKGDADKPLKVMLAAHMDQIGFLVRHVDDHGFLRVQNVGGFDTRNLFARLVRVSSRTGTPDDDLYGVMNPATKPIHVSTDEERKKIPEIHELMVDLGLPGDEVKSRVKIGDMVTIHVPFTRIGETVVAQALDNRVACWIAIEAIRQLEDNDEGHACEVHCVFTVQEEVGLRGAFTSAYSVEPDIGIGIDTTLCVDTPGTPEDQRVTRQGDGAGLTIMDSASIADPELIETFERVAVENDIPHQRSILGRGGTDTAAIQRARGGVRSMTLSCPTRYIHTVVEMVHTHDLFACRDLLAKYLAQATNH